MIKCRHRPIEVEAIKWTGRDEALRVLKKNGLKNFKVHPLAYDSMQYNLLIEVKGAPRIVSIGEYIIKYPNDSFDVLTKEEFEEFYNQI